MFRPIPALVVAVFLAGPQGAKACELLPSRLANLSPEHFARNILIEDDPLASAVLLSTERGYPRGRSIAGAHAKDVHLRALVDRNSGAVTWQVWHELINARGHRNITTVHYMAGGVLAPTRPVALDRRLDECPPTDGVGACNRLTRIGFELPEPVVREIATSWRAGSREPWRLRFMDEAGRDISGGLAPAEVAGLVQALDTWRANRAKRSGRAD